MTNADQIDQLDKHCAISKSPIRIGAKSPYFPIYAPMGQDPFKFLNKRWVDAHQTDLELRSGLLGFGGVTTLIPELDEDLNHILRRGQLWGPTNKIMKGAQSQCHMNSALCWETNQDKLFLATGYALSDDGLWRPHTWCIFPKPRTVHVVETTLKRELYFGFVLTLDETLVFGANNTDMGIYAEDTTAMRYQFECEKSKTAESGKNAMARRKP